MKRKKLYSAPMIDVVEVNLACSILLGSTWTWVSCTNFDDETKTINCYKVVSNKNGNFIYLPASGINSGRLEFHGSGGYYWSSTLVDNDIDYACCLLFNNGYYRCSSNYSCRYYGLPVRPVAEP